MFGMNSVKTVAAAGFLALMASSASAASVACDAQLPDATDNVTANIGCELLLPPIENDHEDDVSGVFGILDWEFVAKIDGLDGTDGPLTLIGDAISGEWFIDASIFDLWDNVMITFKGPNKAEPETVVAYLVNTTNGSYSTPFFKTEGGTQPQEISHVSLFVSGPAVIPVPAAGFLLLGALGGLAALRRRKTA